MAPNAPQFEHVSMTGTAGAAAAAGVTGGAYCDIQDLGATDYSLWFVLDDGQRHEIMLESYSRTEIQRLYDLILPSWTRVRQEAGDAEASANSRQRLAALHAQAR